MEKAITNANQSIEKRITSEQLEKPSSLSKPLSPRQSAILLLIQKTQSRRGLPLTSGNEAKIALSAWEGALRIVPDEYLSRSYDRAADNWDWQDTRHPFTADAVTQSYRILADEDRQRAEAERRNAARRNPDTYQCWHCCDLGYQRAYVRERDRWYSSMRPCRCDLAPTNERSAFPLEAPYWVRNKLGEYVLAEHLQKFGAPNDSFEEFIRGKESNEKCQS